MADFAYWLGYFVMGIGALSLACALSFLVTWFAWEQLKRIHGLKTIFAALRSADERVQEIEDAKRYRWLRNEAYWADNKRPSPWLVIGTNHADAAPVMPGEMDELIDAAMASTPKDGEVQRG